MLSEQVTLTEERMNSSARFRRFRAHGAAIVLVVAFTSAACGSDSAKTGTAGSGGAGSGMGGSAGATDGTPVGLCRQLIETLCLRLNDCTATDGGVVDVAQCSALEDVAFGCDRATSTAFTSCLSDVKNLPCTSLFSATNGLVLPGSCDVPTNIPPSDAQTKCEKLVQVICDPMDLCSDVVPTQTQPVTTCETDGFQRIGCAFAVNVSASYNQCLSDLCATADAGTDGEAPNGWATVPASCNSVISGPTM